MSTQSEIDRVASFVSSSKNTLSNKSADYQKTAELKHFQGDIANAMKAANLRIKNKTTNLQNAYNTLNSKLTGLSFAVDRAEEAIARDLRSLI